MTRIKRKEKNKIIEFDDDTIYLAEGKEVTMVDYTETTANCQFATVRLKEDGKEYLVRMDKISKRD